MKNYEYDIKDGELIYPEELIGKIIKCAELINGTAVFYTDLNAYVLSHEQDCCETVTIIDCDGDMSLIKDEIITNCSIETSKSKENFQKFNIECPDDNFTWSFFKMSTNKRSFTISIYGESNGWYNEEMNLYRHEVFCIQ